MLNCLLLNTIFDISENFYLSGIPLKSLCSCWEIILQCFPSVRRHATNILVVASCGAEDCYHSMPGVMKLRWLASQSLTQCFCAGPFLCLPALTADLLIPARVGELSKGDFSVWCCACTSLLLETFIIVCSCINSCYWKSVIPQHAFCVRFRNFINALQIII